MSFSRVKVVGSGLIGTSIALGLRRNGCEVLMSDTSSENVELAQSLVGEVADQFHPELTIIATPISSLFTVLKSEFEINPESWFIDIGGVKTEVIHQVEEFPEIAARFCATHPMAGREFSGPESAQSDLFEGKAWVLTPTIFSHERVIELAREVVQLLGATTYVLGANEHDRAVALISHLPQVVSSLLAAQLSEASDAELEIAGQGIRDTTRLAHSSPELWSTLLLSNREPLIPILEGVQADLSEVIESLKGLNDLSIKSLIERGSLGKSRLPGKHGSKGRNYAFVPVVIDDQPGRLASLFAECAAAEVNVEDLQIEHSPGQETGLITLALFPDDAEKLFEHLTKQSWLVQAVRR